MAKKTKIKKNLTDMDMLANFKEEPTFENIFIDDRGEEKVESNSSDETFLTTELQEQINKALLELKVNLYKEGIVDYDIKVSCESNKVLLDAVLPSKKKNKKKNR